MRRILFSLVTVLMVSTVAIGATRAYFSDTETSTGNTFSTGTLDLKVDDKDDPNVQAFISNVVPGWSSNYKWCLKNAGTLPGKVFVEFSALTNGEGNASEPETTAESQPYGYIGGRALLGRTEGELGEYLKPNLMRGPCGWSVGSNHFGPGSVWATGPQTNYGKWGMEAVSGNKYDAGVTLQPGETIGIFLGLSLDGDLRAWDGAFWHDIDDNVIQGDSVLFNVTFHLEQI